MPVAERQLRVALTGGVGSGKSTVGDLLAEHGAYRIDADVVAREVVAPGRPGLAQIAARFGADVLDPDGALDRSALASIVFADEAARADLDAITHPLVAERSHELMAAAGPGAIVVYEIPLLAESGRVGEFDVVVVVETPADERVRRLRSRGMDEAQARARISAQATDEQRRAIADEVVTNAGTRSELSDDVQLLWRRLARRRRE